MTRFVAMLTAFVGFTALGVWWAAPDPATLARIGEEVAGVIGKFATGVTVLMPPSCSGRCSSARS